MGPARVFVLRIPFPPSVTGRVAHASRTFPSSSLATGTSLPLTFTRSGLPGSTSFVGGVRTSSATFRVVTSTAPSSTRASARAGWPQSSNASMLSQYPPACASSAPNTVTTAGSFTRLYWLNHSSRAGQSMYCSVCPSLGCAT